MIEGILLVNKPILYTSHDIVDIVRKKLRIRRVGHAGTLDPMATGLLVILVGRSTSLFQRYANDDKEYRGVMTLGIRTNTLDLEGKIIETSDASSISARHILDAFNNFTGRWEQKIPRYSSVRVKGSKCYDMARENLDFDPPKRTVEIKQIELEGYLDSEVYFNIRSSKGTYVRALCDEIGNFLGTGAVLSGLERRRSGDFCLSDSLDLKQILQMPLEDLEQRLINPSEVSVL